ncbi:MAG: hypothetical protein UIH27_11915 [Ruminococcus sp.]|nr:hypothetical protein [Ruminococcus sp.]
MRAFTDYETTQEYTNFQRLPAGAYPIKIIRAEDDGKALCILFDIAEGEFADYYHRKFADDRKRIESGNVKYKGVFRLWYPDGSQYDDNKKRRMKTALKLIKEANNLNVDFTKEWDGAVFKNCRCAMIFRDTEWEYQGKTGMTAQPFVLLSPEDLTERNYEIPKPKYLGNTQASQSAQGFVELDDDGDLPF